MVHGRNFEDRDFGFFAKFIICAQLTYSGGFVRPARARGHRARARTIFFHSSMCDISFPGKMTMLDTFLTFKLIFKQSKLLTSAFFGRARAHTCPKRFINRERGSRLQF